MLELKLSFICSKDFQNLSFVLEKKPKAVFEYLISTARLELILSFKCLKDFQNSSFVLEKKNKAVFEYR